tara:strand:- start:10992 stop:11774 length:783 start_codon:yes stop_codon:yes gene_type:complete
MAAEIKFYGNILNLADNSAPDGRLIAHGAGSGLGFYGPGFQVSVPVGSYQDKTYITDENGAAEGSELSNTMPGVVGAVSEGVVTQGGTVKTGGGGSAATAIALDQLPNYQCPLNIRFTNDVAVKTQNCKLRVFNRANKDYKAKEVTTYVYEARHPSVTPADGQLAHRANAHNVWTTFQGRAASDPLLGNVPTDMNLTPSPGQYGKNGNSSDTVAAKGWSSQEGAPHLATRHDWYLAIASSPDTIGSKKDYGLYYTLEYLE